MTRAGDLLVVANVFTSAVESFRRIFAPRAEPGSGSAGGVPIAQEYSALSAMAASSRFPWVWVCISARVDDLSSLPMRAVKTDGALEEVLTGHSMVELWRHPGPRASGLRLRRQLHFDYGLSGNAFVEQPYSNVLYRLHPWLTQPIVDEFTGREVAWRYNSQRRIAFDKVWHIGGVSWSPGVSMLLGESPLRAMHDDLTTILRAKEMAQRQAGRGRPDLLVTSKNPQQPLPPNVIKRLEENWERFTQLGRGAFFMGEALEATPLNLSSRDIEYLGLRSDVRDTTLAVFGVPPTRAGLAAANYGTAKEQMRTYWSGLLKGEGALFDDVRSMMIPDRSIRIEHDASHVEALQLGYTERLLRVERWVNLGASPKAAAAFEGWPNAPVGNAMAGRMRPPSTKTGEPQEKRATPKMQRLIHEALQQAAERYQYRVIAADGDVDAACSDHELGFEEIAMRSVLERAGVPSGPTLDWARDIAEVNNGAVRLVAQDAADRGAIRIGFPAMAAFSEERAAEIAKGLEAHLQDHRSAA